MCLYLELLLLTSYALSPAPSLFNDSHCAAKTLPLICQEAAETQSDSSGWVDGVVGRGTKTETLSQEGGDFPLVSSQHEAMEHPDFKRFRSLIFTVVAFYHA